MRPGWGPACGSLSVPGELPLCHELCYSPREGRPEVPKRCSEKQNNLNFLTVHKSLNCGRDKPKHIQNYIAMAGISVVN
jgi:hypothetical protein